MTEELADGRREYRVGDKVYEVRPFKGSKGVRAFAIVSRVGEKAKPIWEADARFQADYRELNVLTITRDMALYRVAQAQNAIAQMEEAAAEEARAAEEGEGREADDARERAAALGRAIAGSQRSRDEWQRMVEGALAESDKIEIPQAPGWELRLLAAFPLLWDVAEPEMTALTGLVLIGEDELREARKAGRADEACAELGDALLDELELDELAELMLTAVQVGLERFRGGRARLGKLWGGVTQVLRPPPEEEELRGIKTEPTVGTAEPAEGSTSPSTNGDSSSDSPEPSAGAATPSSTASSGAT